MPPSIAARQGRRHHRRMGRGAARGVRRIPRADRRRQGRAPRRRGDLDEVRAEVERGLAPARPPAEVPGRQARPRRPFQRRRADRRARPRCGMEVVYEGIRLTPGADRQRGARGERPRRRPVDPVGLAPAAGARRDGADARGRARRHAGGRRRHHPAGGRERAEGAAASRAVYTPKDFELNRIMPDIVGLVEHGGRAAA